MNTSHWTPLHLKLLLHTYTTPESWPHNASAVLDYQTELAEAGLIQRHEDTDASYWECTEKGKAHVQQLLTLPLPIPAWINKDGQVLAI
jgi:hypothetical protein